MGYNGTFVILDLLLSLFSPIDLFSPLFFSSIKINILFSFSIRYQSPNLRFLVAAPDLLNIARALINHIFLV